jgi:HTH-type transcriptional regulator/antitoxin HigA
MILKTFKMTVKIIKTEAEYAEALKIIDQLVDCAEGGEDEEKLALIGLLVHEYESHMDFSIPVPDPVTAIKIRMKKQNLKAIDLVGIIGDKPAVSKVLSGKKRLTLPMVKRLHNQLHIPYQSLLG